MYCPKCHAEYRDEFKECKICHMPLVENLPQEETLEFINFVTVFKSGNPAILSLAKSILESEDIVHYVKGDGLQNLFAGGSLGTGYNPVVGLVEIQVDKNDEEFARTLLAEIEENPPESDESHFDGEDIPEEPINKSSGFFRGFFIGALVTGTIFFIYSWNQNTAPHSVEYDLNQDLKTDAFYSYEGDTLVKTQYDRNFDGKIDDWVYYENGAINKSESDDNFDGNIDTWSMFQNDLIVYAEIDINNDGIPDTIEYYKHGVFSEKEWIQGSNRKIYKKAIFRMGIKREEFLDTDLDGKFDKKTTFNKHEDPVSEIGL